MKFRARDLPPKPEPAKDIVQPTVIIQKVVDDTPKVDTVKAAEAKLMLTLRQINASLVEKIDSIPKVKAWKHKIVRHDSGFIKEIISTPIFKDDPENDI